MKKYKVLFSPDQPSDKEVDSYKDFNQLLRKHQSALLYQRWLKAGISAFSVAAIVGAYVLLFPGFSPASESLPAPVAEEVREAPVPENTGLVAEAVTTAQPPVTLFERKSPATLLPEEEPENAQKTPALVKEHRQEPKPSGSEAEENVKGAEFLANKASPASARAGANKSETTGELGVFTKPEPPMGYQALQEFFSREMKLPEDTAAERASGIVLVSFAINERGEAEDIEVEKSLNEACDAEAVRLVKNMPAWKPATVKGEPVKTRLALPVRF